MNIINNYRDLSIGMYLDICDVDKREDLSDIEKQVSIISLLSGMAEEEIYNLPLDEYTKLATQTHFLSSPYDGEVLVAKTYHVGGWELKPIEDFRKITTAQYVDFQTFAKDCENNIVELLSTMVVPKGKKYNQDYDVVEVQKALRQHLSVADAMTLYAFFFVQYGQLIKDSLTFSKEAAMKLRDPEKKKRVMREILRQEALLKNGDGLRM